MKPPSPAHPARPPAVPLTPASASLPGTPQQPLTEPELEALQALLDRLPPTLEPLDVVMADGYLCGVLLQPRPVAEADWLALVCDVEGRSPPADFVRVHLPVLRTLLRRRHAELAEAIAQRRWFDPWIYPGDEADSPSDTVMPWVAGFATAVDHFTALMDRHEDALLEPLALLYRHLDPDELEDAEALLAEIDTYEPASTLDEAVEDLVRAVLLTADVVQPLAPSGHARAVRSGRAGRPGGPGGGNGPGGRDRGDGRTRPAGAGARGPRRPGGR